MGPELLGSIISAGAGLAGSAASGIASGKMNKRAVKYNKWALQEQQHQSATEQHKRSAWGYKRNR